MHSSKSRSVVTRILLFASIVCALASSVCGYLFLALYWPHRHSFNELGRVFSEEGEVVLLEQSAVLLVPALVFLFLAVLLGSLWLHRRRRADRA